MSDDVIQGPGFYKQRDGGKAEVRYVDPEHHASYGLVGMSNSCVWFKDTGVTINQFCHSYDITGPWHPDPPEPPAGYELRDRDTYQLVSGDLLFSESELGANKWRTPYTSFGLTAAQYDGHNPSRAPHYIASPIPKPFSISEHGPGVYETRDGREATVTKVGGTNWSGRPIEGRLAGGTWDIAWSDDGNYLGCNYPEIDLVRYLRPLPKPTVDPGEGWRLLESGETVESGDEVLLSCGKKWIERIAHGDVVTNEHNPHRRRVTPLAPQEWAPTNELRWSDIPGWECGAVYVGSSDKTSPRFRRLEQKWTNGTDSEWRAVGVTP